MNNNISITTKIIVAISVAFILSFGAVYYVVFKNYKDVLLDEQTKKINILLNTISPTVKINLEFRILENIDMAFEQLLESNHEIKTIKLIDLSNNVIVKKITIKEYKNIIVRTKPLVDKMTKKTLGYLKISYSNSSYLNAIEKFQNMFVVIGISFIIFIMVFMRLLFFIFKPLMAISKKLESYNPEQSNAFKMEKLVGANEISIINNAIYNMLQKINSHTLNLRKQVKLEMKKNEDKEQHMLQQSRLAQMGEMISMIAHQWRQPLASISSTVSALELKVMMDQYEEKYFTKQLENISKYSQYLSSTIDDFRNFFKFNDTKVDTTLEEIVLDALNIIEISIENKGIKIEKEYKSNMPILTYRNEIQQVVLNLLKNAEDILIDNNVENPTIHILTIFNDQSDIIEIKDNAGGVPVEIINNIFDPYFTTKEKKDGTGLGLYMSKKIIENRCKGTLSVVNEIDGAKFIIMLPKSIGD